MPDYARLDETELLRHAAAGVDAAREQLFARHRDRLRSMIAVRMDPRVATRVDPSDVVQETLTVAFRRLPRYARSPTIPFYPWLRAIAMDRIVDAHRQHLRTQARTVLREEPLDRFLPDQSATELARRLVASQTSNLGRAARVEQRATVRQVLQQLNATDREVLALIYLEQLSLLETAAVLEISTEAVRSRQRRALLRFGELLGKTK
jgi:RNA polymerase sigma-70 factor (ECF subfamily)